MKISNKTKRRIALVEALGSSYTFTGVLWIDPLREAVYSSPSIAVPYSIALGYLFADGVWKIVAPGNESVTEKIVRNMRKYFKRPSRWWIDKTPITEKEAQKKYRWYIPLHHKQIV